MIDPYVYPGTNVLKNKEDIRVQSDLDELERLVTRQRQSQGFPDIDLSEAGYKELHRFLFQDVFTWAGTYRTIDIAKGNSYFCRHIFIEREMQSRFSLIGRDRNLASSQQSDFSQAAAAHICELNAIHPFREGNGRTLRAFLVALANKYGHRIDLRLISPELWLKASMTSFQRGDFGLMCDVIGRAVLTSRDM